MSQVHALPRLCRAGLGAPVFPEDFMFWVVAPGRVEHTANQLPSPSARFAANPQLSGKDGGPILLNLYQSARDAVVLLGCRWG